jgi:hypothetical protein
MRLSSLCSLVVSGLGVGLASLSATASPLVIPGIGPEEAQQIVNESARRRGARPHRGAAGARPCAGRANARRGGFGAQLRRRLHRAFDDRPRPDAARRRRLQYADSGAAGLFRAGARRARAALSASQRRTRAASARLAARARRPLRPAGNRLRRAARPGTIVSIRRTSFFISCRVAAAMRYGIGVGRPGFEWSGVKTITRKAEWPAWTPPPEMLKRRPDLPRHSWRAARKIRSARARCISARRSIASMAPTSHGPSAQNVSSGCIRMRNSDVKIFTSASASARRSS